MCTALSGPEWNAPLPEASEPSRCGCAWVSRVMPDDPDDAGLCGQVHYVNFPEDAKDVRSTLADNARWANSVRQRLCAACLHCAKQWPQTLSAV